MNTRLKTLRSTLGLSQIEFGETIKTSHAYLSQMESGKKPIKERIFKLICKVHNVSESWLRTGEGEMFNPVKADEDDIEVARRVLKAKIRALPPEAQRLILDLCLEIQQAADQPAPNPSQI